MRDLGAMLMFLAIAIANAMLALGHGAVRYEGSSCLLASVVVVLVIVFARERISG